MLASHILKSLLFFIFLLALVITSIILCRHCVIRYRNGALKIGIILGALVCIFLTLSSIILLGDYIYPFERTLEPIPHGVLVLPEDKFLRYPGEKFWHGAYEEYGLYAESFYFDPDGENPKYGIDWPPMDFEHYSYIITYGQEIDKLTYNVWDTIDIPVRTGAKVGHMTLKDEFSPEMIYIYRIPKLRIENDVNNTCGE